MKKPRPEGSGKAAVDEGFEPIKVDALEKVKLGLTDEAEVFPVLH